MKGYVKLAVEEGGTILCGEGKDGPLDLKDENKNVSNVMKIGWVSCLQLAFSNYLKLFNGRLGCLLNFPSL